MIEFETEHSDAGFLVRAVSQGVIVPVSVWQGASIGGASQVAAQLFEWIEGGEAEADENSAVFPDRLIASLSEKAAATLNLPPLSDVFIDLLNKGTLDSDTFHIEVTWRRPNGQAVVGAIRTGCLIRIGGQTYRLPLPLYQLADAIDEFHNASITDHDARLAAWAKIQSGLPDDASAKIKQSGYLSGIRVFYAQSVSLQLSHGTGEVTFNPVLHSAETEHPLLPEYFQNSFSTQVGRLKSVRGRYALGDGHYVVLAPALTKAVEVIRKAQASDARTRTDFARNPRAAFRAALGEEYDEAFVENIFVETAEYSERVLEIGLWQKRVLPWIDVPREPWLPPDRAGLLLNGKRIELTHAEATDLLSQVKQARADAIPSVPYKGEDVPATAETQIALEDVVQALGKSAEEEAQVPPVGAAIETESNDKKVLIIEANLEGVGYEAEFTPRAPELQPGVPSKLLATLKPHQNTGLIWLQKAWQSGRSGVLLADDMGLGKTLQSLTFLAWLRQAMDAGSIKRAPLLIVAPTGLLANWQQESDLHLELGGLGNCLKAYGPSLKEFRSRTGAELLLGAGVLDESKLAAADWVLTTYETVRDYQMSFGRIPFAVVVFDEAQKIKTPGTLVSEAAKALRANFIIAMTGTPIENRLADLWCIVDTAQPGLMGDLKVFSARYERDLDEQKFQEIKDRLSKDRKNIPALMLRRLKVDNLEGLPQKTNHVLPMAMPQIQAEAYAAAVRSARGTQKGKILQVLHTLRSVSLHPWNTGEEPSSDEEFINSSARYISLFKVLDEIRTKNEKALIFLEFLKDQAFLAGLIQRRYQLLEPPMLINGEVAGDKRQQKVNRFQSERGKFGVMILSPKAGGVGLTLTAANHVIHLSRWWNPAVEDQCTDRIYRIGQDKPIHVYYPLALLPGAEDFSFDRKLDALLERKRNLSVKMLLPPGASDSDAEELYRETVFDL